MADERPGATLGVVSGRRRQGKSFLLEAVCQQAEGFYVSAQEATEAESLALIGAALTRYLDPLALSNRGTGPRCSIFCCGSAGSGPCLW